MEAVPLDESQLDDDVVSRRSGPSELSRAASLATSHGRAARAVGGLARLGHGVCVHMLGELRRRARNPVRTTRVGCKTNPNLAGREGRSKNGHARRRPK